MEKKTYIRDLYRFEGFRARATMERHTEDSNGWIITLERRQKKQSAQHAGQRLAAIVIGACIKCGTWIPGKRTSTLSLNIVGSIVPGVEL